MLEARKAYKHDRCLDVAIEVHGIRGKWENGDTSALVSWWNVRAKVPTKVVRYEVVRIKVEEMQHWKEIEIFGSVA